MVHSIFVEGTMFTSPTKQELRDALPEYSEEEIDTLLGDYISDTGLVSIDYNSLEAWKEQQRSTVNNWRDDQFKKPIIFNYSGRLFKASLEYISILKSYLDYLPEGTIWTDENDNDMTLSPEEVTGLISAMQESISETYSGIHREARTRKNIINQFTSIPENTED